MNQSNLELLGSLMFLCVFLGRTVLTYFIFIERLYHSLASQFGVDSYVLENTLKEMRETLYVDN
jgi:hypothetical protein